MRSADFRQWRRLPKRRRGVVMLVTALIVGPLLSVAFDAPTFDASVSAQQNDGGISAQALETFSTSRSITIEDNSNADPYSTAIDVHGIRGALTDVTIQIRGINHGRPSDIDIMLVSPRGIAVIVMSDVGDDAAISSTNITVDDNAATSMPTAGALVTGSYKPTNADTTNDNFGAPAPSPNGTTMAAFQGISGNDLNGRWLLYVRDHKAQIAGTITNGWSITIRTANSGPTAKDDKYKTKEDKDLDVKAPGVLKNDKDPDNDRLKAKLAKKPKHGKLKLKKNGSFHYEPDNDFTGKDRFTYKAVDPDGLSDQAKVTIKVR